MSPDRHDNIHERCLHEGELATMSTNIKTIIDDMQQVKKSLNNGLKVDIALCKQGLSRAWWWLGTMSIAFVVAAIKTVFFA